MKYIKAFEDFGNDYPKKRFIELSHEGAMEYADQILDLIKNAYSKKGGNIEIKSTEDLKNGDITYWVLKDIDQDPDVDLAIGGKFTKNRVKVTVLGQDGYTEAKKESIKKMIDLIFLCINTQISHIHTSGFLNLLHIFLLSQIKLPVNILNLIRIFQIQFGHFSKSN